MKPVQKTIYFSPSMLFFFEDMAKERKCSLNEAVVKYLEQSLSKDKSESKLEEIANEQTTIRELIVQLVDVIQDIQVKK